MTNKNTITNTNNNNNTNNNINTEKQTMTELENQHDGVSLPCYSQTYPPELDAHVVVQVQRVDDTGIWGNLVDWKCQAYLPMGSIGKEKGRGERKAQMHFLTRARRSLKQKRP